MTNKENLINTVKKYFLESTESSDDEYREKKKKRMSEAVNKNFIKNRLLNDIIKVVGDYTVIDWTDEESNCCEIKILLHKKQDILDDDRVLMKELKGIRFDLRIFVSVLEPYYFMFVQKTKYTEAGDIWEFETIKCYDDEIKRVVKRVEAYLDKKYIKLSEKDVEIVVPGIETELKETGKATVFDCLFTDLVNLT